MTANIMPRNSMVLLEKGPETNIEYRIQIIRIHLKYDLMKKPLQGTTATRV